MNKDCSENFTHEHRFRVNPGSGFRPWWKKRKFCRSRHVLPSSSGVKLNISLSCLIGRPLDATWLVGAVRSVKLVTMGRALCQVSPSRLFGGSVAAGGIREKCFCSMEISPSVPASSRAPKKIQSATPSGPEAWRILAN